MTNRQAGRSRQKPSVWVGHAPKFTGRKRGAGPAHNHGNFTRPDKMMQNKLSPVMQQYLDMKAENPNALLLFRLGDFYEAFFGDAVGVSKALDLVLTRRGTDERGVDIPMCGIPWHAAENYLARLVRQGMTVAIAEQMESPDEAKEKGHKQIERKIVRVITPGTLTDDNLLTPKRSNYLAAVYGQDIAVVDISTGEFLVGTGGAQDLVKLDPAEVLYDERFAENPAILQIREMFNTTPLNPKQYDNFDLSAMPGHAQSDTFAPGGSPAAGAARMLFAYLKQTQRDNGVRLAMPKKLWAGEQLLIDPAAWKSLEIDRPLNAGGTTLLDIIDKTKTAAGGRTLRNWLRNLLADKGAIEERLGHIEHLVMNAEVWRNMSGLLSKVPDVRRALSRLLSMRGMPRDIKSVLDFLHLLPSLKVAGTKLDSALSLKFQGLEMFDNLAAELFRAIGDNLPAFFRDGGIIKRGFSAELDRTNDLAHDRKAVILSLQSEYSEKAGERLKIKFNGIIGYFIEVPAKNADKLLLPDSGFIHRQTLMDNMRFTTPRLTELDSEIKNAIGRSAAIEQKIIEDLIENVRAHADGISEAADFLAEVDALGALSEAATEWGWTRPKIAAEPTFKVSGGRHPAVEKTLRENADLFVKNDCDLSEKRIALLTGPNMSGKSTYLRQNALIVVLAHLGSFVPADSAEIGIADRLFSRVGASDNLASGQSTFMVEMTETANIVNNATARSFIIFDEIGRGTATFDGMAIAGAVLEWAAEVRPRCLFATHYHELVDKKLPSVRNLTTKIAEAAGEIIFMHKIIDGIASRSYGIHVAKMAGMPDKVVAAAERALAELERGASKQRSLF